MSKAALINAHNECVEWRDASPDKELSPIGHVFKEWCECAYSTEIPHWIWFKVIGQIQRFVYRIGKVGYYERFAEIEGIEPV